MQHGFLSFPCSAESTWLLAAVTRPGRSACCSLAVGTDSAALTLTAEELDALQSAALMPAAITLAALQSAELLLAAVAFANLPLVAGALPSAAGPRAAVAMDALLLGSLHRPSYRLPQWCCTPCNRSPTALPLAAGAASAALLTAALQLAAVALRALPSTTFKLAALPMAALLLAALLSAALPLMIDL